MKRETLAWIAVGIFAAVVLLYLWAKNFVAQSQANAISQEQQLQLALSQAFIPGLPDATLLQ